MGFKSYTHFTPPKSADQALRDLKRMPPEHWEKRGEKKAMELFRFISSQVPAYQKLLAEHKLSSKDIRSVKDFRKLPVTDKDSYLRKYAYEELFPGGEFARATIVSATSGTTGTPFYFPRGEDGDAQHEFVSEIFLKNQFEIDKKSTLVLLGFGMGIWIGGMVSYKYYNQITRKGQKITVAPVGPNAELFLKTLKALGKHYDQVIFVGYPPFLKDMMDSAERYGVRLSDYSIKISMAAEGISNSFRVHLAEKAGIKNIYTDIVNIYGSVELAAMANETTLTTLIRELAEKNEMLFKEVFPGTASLSTLAQYYPEIVYFEEQNGEVLATGKGSSLPLMRYRFPDRGGVVSFQEMLSRCKNAGVDILNEAKKRNLEKYILKLPFVWISDRSDGAVSLMSIGIRPGTLKEILSLPILQKFCTGKFHMRKHQDKKMNEYLELFVEMKHLVVIDAETEKEIEKNIITGMRKNITEFDYLLSINPKKKYIRFHFSKYQDPKFFSSSGKHAWVG